MLYLDLPVGVSPHGFDTWRHRGLFAACATGAPPDPYFTGGQNWGFPPMHPDACREDGYGYLRACLRFHMLHAEYLRLDHVMAFRRLFWIPSGLSAADGVYVRYRDEELYAVLCLESHRNRCRLVGENLGTVPAEVNAALTRHDLCGLYVGQYEMQPTRPALRPVPRNCVVSVNTHDMPPIARMWSAGDVDDRIGLGMLEKKRRGAERRTRERMKRALIAFLRAERLLGKGRPDLASVRDALLRFLARSPADFVLVNLEDLWLETTWQNIPGTMREHPNWRRRLRLTLEEIEGDGEIGRVLRMVDRARKVTRPGSG
jgi:4-alpha-glucanotransferase